MPKNDIPVFDSTKAHRGQSAIPNIPVRFELEDALAIRLSGSGVECSHRM
jgi:hypothetical protein